MLKFGVVKCAVVHPKSGQCGENGDEKQNVNGSVHRHLYAVEFYTYLGVQTLYPVKRHCERGSLS